MAAPEIGNVPFQEAIDYFRAKQNISTERWDQLRGETHARMFTVAGATKGSVLQDIRNAVDDALANGTTITEFRKVFDETVAKNGWDFTGKRGWRTRVIFDTNLRTAHAAGRWKQIIERQRRLQARKPDETLYLVYETAGDERVRPQHRAWNRIVRPVDDPFWDTHYPPNGYGCRCIVRSLTLRQLQREGLQPTSDKVKETLENNTPAGIDVGFDHNVGKSAWFPSPGRFSDADIGHYVAATAVAGPNFERFIRGEAVGIAPVGHIDGTLAAAIGSRAREVRLSSDTMGKQRVNHSELTVEEYRLLPDIMKRGLVIKENKNNVLMFFFHSGQWYRATVKRTADGEELFLVSFHRAKAKDLRRLRRRGTVIREEE